jgi:hypothetical protein
VLRVAIYTASTSAWQVLSFSGLALGSFATEGLKGFPSVQVSPLTDRGRDKAWITSTFIMGDGLRIARPSGIARLTLHAVRPKSALRPVGGACWNLLCEML